MAGRRPKQAIQRRGHLPPLYPRKVASLSEEEEKEKPRK
jgi:hypothetical protein